MSTTTRHSTGRDAVEVDVESVDVNDIERPLEAMAVAKALDEAWEEHTQKMASLLGEVRSTVDGEGIDLPANPTEVPRSDMGGREWVGSLEGEVSFSILATLTALVEHKRKAAIALDKHRQLRQRIKQDLDDFIGRPEPTTVRRPTPTVEANR